MIEAKTQKLVSDVTHYTPANPGAAAVSHRGRNENPASRQSRCLHAAHLFLAGRSAPREIQRNLERGESRAVSRPRAIRAPTATPARPLPLLEVRAVAKRFGSREVLKTFRSNIATGEFLTLLGESGSGKTTLLRLIAGFEQPTAGEIWMSGERLDTLPPYKRRVNTVFQQYALFPHLSVRENVAYGLRVKKTPRDEIAARVKEALRMVKMEEFADVRPATTKRRPAATRRTGSRARQSTAASAPRRAAFRARRQSAQRDAERIESSAARSRHHFSLRHPRPG